MRLISTLAMALFLVNSTLAIDTRGALRAIRGDPADSHHDFGNYAGSEAAIQSMSDGQMEFKFDASKKLTQTKSELLKLLESFRTEIKVHFVDLEKAIHDKINGIFNIACANVPPQGCWVAMKVECQLYDVQNYVHTHRCQLVSWIKEKLVTILKDFDDYLGARGLGKDSCKQYDSSTTAEDCQAEAQKGELSDTCKCNTKMEIDGILGMFLQDGDTQSNCYTPPSTQQSNPGMVCDTVDSPCKQRHQNNDIEEVWAMKREQQCPELHACVNSPNAPACAGRHESSADHKTYCGDVVAEDDHECLQQSPAYNKDDTACVRGHLGLLGLTNYYGGSCASIDDDAGHKGRVGRLITSAFECALQKLDGDKASCTTEERKAHHEKCVDSACDCSCFCGGHLTDETKETCDVQNMYGVTALNECDQNTCKSPSWRTSKKCSASTERMNEIDCSAKFLFF